MVKENIGIMCLVETWLQEGDNVAIRPVIEDIRNKDGISCRGTEGMLVVVKPEIRNEVKVNRKIINNKRVIVLNVKGIHIVLSYIPPSVSGEEFKNIWKEINKLTTSEQDVIIMGDFNARLGDSTGDHQLNKRGRWLNTFLKESSLSLINPNTGKWTSYCKCSMY